jgi:DNA-binding XRE family transcriptional regulator
MMNPESFRRRRNRHSMTQKDCAKELGFKDLHRIINYEKGDSEIPRNV